MIARSESDPFASLGAALQAVVEQAVANALASLPPPTAEGPVMLSVPEAARQLGVGTTKVKELIASGRLTSATIGRRRLIPSVAIRELASNLDENVAS